jgi:thiaminase
LILTNFQVQFARATALGAYKSSSLTDIGRSVQQVVTLQEEIKLHIDFCKEQGLSVKDIESQEEDQATTAYTRYVLDIGQSQDWLALQIALLPCLIGYGIIAKRLFDDTNTLREGRYWTWNTQRPWQGALRSLKSMRANNQLRESMSWLKSSSTQRT